VTKLLLADDSPTTQKVVQLTFADEGIEVVVADDGDTAMELFNHHKPDVVLADINIPGLNGYEVCEAIRKHEGNGKTPVILLAGSFEPFNVEEARRVGASDYLTKPFSSIRRLVATVTALLDSVAKEDTTVGETVQPTITPVGVAAEPVHVTNDIEQLYSQSFAETVEMPHTVAERAVAAAGGVMEAERPAINDEAAFDDELIETTISQPAQEETFETPQQEVAGEVEQETVEPVQEPVYTETRETASTLADDIPQDLGGFDLAAESQNGNAAHDDPPAEVESEQTYAAPSNVVQFSEIVQRDQPTEEFAIDQSGDETYFEPASETLEQPVMTEVVPEPPSPAFLGLSYAGAESESQPGETVEAESNSFEAAVDNPESSEMETPAPLSYEIPVAEPETSTQDERAAPPTPWESVAEPKTDTYSFDDLNLLEIPVPGGQYRPMDEVNEPSARTKEISSEVVEQIVKATATQISEELVREIAARIVPKVIEEVMARKDGGDIDKE